LRLFKTIPLGKMISFFTYTIIHNGMFSRRAKIAPLLFESLS